MKLYFSIEKNKLIRHDDEIITAFSKNINKCFFKCEKPLYDIYKYALFTDALGVQSIVPLGLGKYVSCVIPEQTLKSNYFAISVFAEDRFTTTQEKIIIQRSGFNDKTQSLLESLDDSDISENNGLIDEDDMRHRFNDFNYRHNRFEIQEHPYY